MVENNIVTGIYDQLPGAIRSIVASLFGFYLRYWRYGPELELLVAEALAREHRSPEQLKKWQEERLAYILHRAATRVPYYREFWQRRRRSGDKASPECLENWPILEKETLRENPKAFVADDCDVRRMFNEHTSGTSGKPLDVWWSRETVRAWYALCETRCRRWYGVSIHDRWAILGGRLIIPQRRRRPPFWVWNAALKQLYLSSYHLAPDLIPHYLDALLQYRIAYLWGYSSSLYALALEANRLKRHELRMTVVITNAEPLFDYQRTTIAEAFQCPVRETYGMAEIVSAASECEAGRLHIWPEVGILEVTEGNGAGGSNIVGDLICTGLLNADMPLIRYRVGDRGSQSEADSPCPCGRSLPQLESLEGRVDDILYTVDGRRIGRLDPVFKAQLPIREAQIIQESLDRLRVVYVPAPGFSPATARSIIERLRARLGEVEVLLEPVDEVPRSANGKFRAVINLINRRSSGDGVPRDRQ